MKFVHAALFGLAGAAAVKDAGGPMIVDQDLPSDAIPITSSTAVESIDDPPTPSTTSLPDLGITSLPTDTASSTCSPSSICVRGRTCEINFGGCYDKNFCSGTTSYSMPSVTCDFTSTLFSLPVVTTTSETTSSTIPTPDAGDTDSSTLDPLATSTSSS